MQFSTVFILVAATLTTVYGEGSQMGSLPKYPGSQGGAPQYGSQGGAPQYGSQGGAPQYGSQTGGLPPPPYGSQGSTQPQYGSQGGAPQPQPPYGSQGGSTQPQYGSQGNTQYPQQPVGLPNPYAGQEDVDPYANEHPLPDEDNRPIPDIQCSTDNTQVQSTYSVSNTCTPGGFCFSKPFGLYNEKTGTCMTGKSYSSFGMAIKRLLGKKVDPKIRLSTHKCSMGMAFKRNSEHSFGWRTAPQSGDGTHLNLVHYPSNGATLCAVKRKKVTFFYPCDDCKREASRYTLSSLSKRGSYQIQVQPNGGRGKISCLTANILSHKVTSQTCGGLLCYTHQQWRPVSCN